MPGDEPKGGDKYTHLLTQSVELLRDNVRWTLVAFGAIATVLLAGSQLSNLGRFEWNAPRLWIAFVAAVVALLAAALAVRSALAVAYTGHTELDNLDKDDIAFVERNPSLLEGYESVPALKKAYEQAIADRFSALNAPKIDADEIEGYGEWYHYLDSLVDKLLASIRYDRIRRQAKTSRRNLFFASLAAGLALVIFAWAANPGDVRFPTSFQNPPSRAALELTDAGKKALTSVLGTACVKQPAIPIILLGVSETNFDIVTLGTKGCEVVRFSLTYEYGRVVKP